MISFDKERFPDSSFPFSINTVPVENNFPIHIHDFCELVIVLQGSAVHQVNKRHYGISAGDIFLLRKNVSHGFIHVNNLLLCNIMFYPEKILLPLNDLKYEEEFHDFLNFDEPELENQFYRNRLRLSFEKLMEIKSFVNQMNNEYNKKFQGYKSRITFLLNDMLILLTREYAKNTSEIDNNNALSNYDLTRLYDVIAYLEDNFLKSIKLSELARIANLSKRHFFRVFKENFKMTPNDFLVSIKLRYACCLLKETNYQVSKVAVYSGFNDSNYFSRIFKKKLNQTPLNYRNSTNKSRVGS